MMPNYGGLNVSCYFPSCFAFRPSENSQGPRARDEISFDARGIDFHSQSRTTRNAHPPGIEATLNQFPPLDAGSLVLGWSIGL